MRSQLILVFVKNVQKPVGILNGGELLKITLSTVLGSRNQPDLIIVDEPTNNLDIKSIEMLENVLNQSNGEFY